MESLLEVRIPISPTPFFFRRVHFLAASLRALGGPLLDHEIVICVGGDVDPYNLYDAQPWSRQYPVTWRWISRDAFRSDSYWDTSHEVFRQHSRSKFVMCADADIIFIRDFSSLLDTLTHEPAVAGVIGHGTPFKFRDGEETPAELWRRFYEGYGLCAPPFIHEHTGWEALFTNPDRRYSAPYFNFGMVVAPYKMMDKINGEMVAADAYARENFNIGNKRFQLAFSLAIQKHGLPIRVLPFRYNFANLPQFDEHYKDELKKVIVVHYALKTQVNRDSEFATLEGVARLIGRRDLSGSNEVLRQRLEELFPIVAAEESIGR